MNEKGLTGYPSIDKPWMKYYSKEDKKWSVNKCTMFEYIYEKNKEYLDDTALLYMGKKFTYRILFDNIDTVARAFRSIGIGIGDRVAICSVTTPEIIYSIYGLNKLGATVNLLEPRNNAERIKEYLLMSKCKYMIMLDICYSKIQSILDETNLQKIIVVSPTDSALLTYKIGRFITKKRIEIPFGNKYEKWSCFIRRAEKQERNIETAPYDAKLPAVIVYTGGTTGIPKGAMLSNDAINHIAEFARVSTCIGAERQEDFLGIMPPFIAYGLCCGIHGSLSLGNRMIVIPNFKAENFTKLVLKYKPNHFLGVPSFFEELACCNKKIDLKFIKCVIAGGDKMSIETEQKINNFFKKNNSTVRIHKGYGMTEMSSAVVVTTDVCNKEGSVGIPLIGNNVKVIDPETGQELTYGQQGELCISTHSMMMGYLDNEEETAKLIEVDRYGEKWVHTGDIAYIDEDGCIFIIDRMKRMIIRPDGHNVFPSVIETVLVKHISVESVTVVGMPDKNGASGMWPIAFVVLKEEFIDERDKIKAELVELMKQKLPERDKAEEIFFKEFLPLTPIGKVDYQQLEKEAKQIFFT
ncbi:MAG: acyl--CoA ligase [Lachnospiraceae bacterium]|nr:acyl--CoA ligase [Lachnospiraceae bacterium]